MFDKSRNNKRTGSERVRAARQRARKRANFEYINFKGVFIFIVIIILLIIASIFGVKHMISYVNEREATRTTTVDKLKKQVSIGGVNISGMTREQAMAAVENVYPWSMKVHLGEDREKNTGVSNLLKIKLNKILDSIYSEEGNVKENYDLNFDDMDSEISEEIKRIQNIWDVQPKNGSIAGFDSESKTFVYESEETGYLIDENKLKEDIMEAVNRKNFSADISVIQNEVKPTVTLSEAKERYKVIGTFTTKTTDNNDRNTNISLACESLDGLILKPGEEFSFNNTTGNRTVERGYKAAGAYVNGVLVEEPGGGVCQVSSTLYNAVIFSGLKTTERHAHSYEPSYVIPGEDAMVSYDGYAGPDMKFINTSDTAIAIRAVLTGQTLTCSIIGIPILEEGITVEMKSVKTGDINPPAPEYIEDKNIAPGKQVVITEAKAGSKWTTDYITKKDGVIVKEEAFHNSIYKGKPAKIKRNTSSVDKSEKTSEISTESISTDESTETENSTIETVTAEESESTNRKKDNKSSEQTTVEKATEKTTEKAAEKTTGKTTEKTIEKTTEKITGKTEENTVKKSEANTEVETVEKIETIESQAKTATEEEIVPVAPN